MRGFRFASVVLILSGCAAAASAAPLNAASMPLAPSAISITPRLPVGPPERIVNYTTSSGQTIAVRLFASTPEQRRRMDAIADKLEGVMESRFHYDDYQSVGNPDNDGGWAQDDIGLSIAESIALGCAVIGGLAQRAGFVNIYLDAANALCLSVVIVDLGQRLGESIYQGYLASFRTATPFTPSRLVQMIALHGVMY